MKIIITAFFCILMTLWLGTALFLSGSYDWTWLPDFLTSLRKPASTQQFADSLGMTDSLFSSIALILAVATVFIQGKEMRESTVAQRRQAEYLQMQISHHDRSAMISSIATALNHFSAKRDWNRATIEKLEQDLKTLCMSDSRREYQKKLLINSKAAVSSASNSIKDYERYLTSLMTEAGLCDAAGTTKFS